MPSKVWHSPLTRSRKNVLPEVTAHGMGMIIRSIGRVLILGPTWKILWANRMACEPKERVSDGLT